MPRQEGQFLCEDFYMNTGGLNTADSPFIVEPGQCTGGQNFDLFKRGGFRKRGGHLRVGTQEAQARTLGYTLYDNPSLPRKLLRCAGTKIESQDTNTYVTTVLDNDTNVSNTGFFSNGTAVPTSGVMFNQANGLGTAWIVGGGLDTVLGAMSNNLVTNNGVATAVLGTFTSATTGSGGTLPTGTYLYGIALRKAGTQASGNVDFGGLAETSANLAVTLGQNVALNWTFAITPDPVRYDAVLVYRSTPLVSGVLTGFTVGTLVSTQLLTASSSFTDTGVAAQITLVPRAGNVSLDYSPLPPSATYQCVALWKRRLVVAEGNNVYISEVNLPEAWPLTNRFAVPSGGKVTALAVVPIVSATGATVDEMLCIFKENELRVLSAKNAPQTGGIPGDYTSWSLDYIDDSGCGGANAVVRGNGYLAWVGYRGIYMWDGSGKPVYVTATVEDTFTTGGDTDKSKLSLCTAVFVQSRNEIQFYLSSTTGTAEQRFVYKLDLKLTQLQAESTLAGRRPRAVFTPDILPFSVYGAIAFLPSPGSGREIVVLGDDQGYTYSAYAGLGDAVSTDVQMYYITPYMHFGTPNAQKTFYKVVLWVSDNATPGINYNYTLDYWSAYKLLASELSSEAQSDSTNSSSTSLVYGVGKWGVNYWGASAPRIKQLVFNLNSTLNNNSGTCLRLRIGELGHLESPVVYGYSVYYQENALKG